MELQRWSPDSATRMVWAVPFPAGWWRELLPGDDVQLSVRARGSFAVVGYSPGGRRDVLHESSGQFPAFSTRPYAWLAIETRGDAELDEVTWSAGVDLELPGVVAVVPTFRREADAAHQAAAFLRSDLIRRVTVIDQGGTLRAHEPFAQLLSENAERLQLVEQQNLGGSGGYARGMLESLSDPECAVLLSDDDAALPDESLRRMLTAQALAAQQGRKLVMATPMFSAEDPALLISAAERVDLRTFQWGAADGLREPISVAGPISALIDALAVRETPNYAGWWGALLPPGMVREVGLPAPYFLKWDDAEYGLHASRNGYEFMALPGTGVWHPTWGAQKTLTTWVAVLLHRNRLATASAYEAGRGVIGDSLVHQFKHIFSLQYDVAELWSAGIEQFLNGPGWLGADLAEARQNAQAVVDGLPPTAPSGTVPVQGRVLRGARAALNAVTGLLRSGGAAESSCPASTFTWRDGFGMDRVVLTDDGGEPTSELVRNPKRARTLLSTALKQHATLARRWSALSPEYRDALAKTTTLEYWREVLGVR